MGNALLLALALMGQAPATAAPPTSAASAPTDDYGYVSWCYGALGGYVDLYDKVMPEVTRIEKAFPSPGGVEASLKVYPEMRAQARMDLKTYTAAITAAEKASPRPISEYGRLAINKGRSVWAGSDATNKARLAQVWMSWSPPGDCETRAKTLEKRSNVLGKALIYNAAPAPAPAPDTAPQPAPEPVAPAPIEQAAPPVAETPKPAPVAKPMAKAPAPKPIKAPAAKAEIIIDLADPKPCAGRLEPAKRGGKDVLVCKPD
ncbi:hypothetical protein [Caulobacter sp.]|uniref:hypothetical protein n=1 Tax=Caulobacter sp. TaxID=78 RepID=UPI003BA89408